MDGSPGDLGHAEPQGLLTQDASHTQEVASQRRLESGWRSAEIETQRRYVL